MNFLYDFDLKKELDILKKLGNSVAEQQEYEQIFKPIIIELANVFAQAKPSQDYQLQLFLDDMLNATFNDDNLNLDYCLSPYLNSNKPNMKALVSSLYDSLKTIHNTIKTYKLSGSESYKADCIRVHFSGCLHLQHLASNKAKSEVTRTLYIYDLQLNKNINDKLPLPPKPDKKIARIGKLCKINYFKNY